MPLPPISPSGVATAFQYPVQTSAGQGITAQLSAFPGSVNTPIIFQLPSPMTGGNQPQIFIIATGAATAWGGCIVNLSLDNTTFGTVGTILRGGVQGVLTATFPSHSDPDTVDTLSVNITESGQQIIEIGR